MIKSIFSSSISLFDTPLSKHVGKGGEVGGGRSSKPGAIVWCYSSSPSSCRLCMRDLNFFSYFIFIFPRCINN
jgi:hypothetical protein